jgi:ketosteroid isomerase-like protein
LKLLMSLVLLAVFLGGCQSKDTIKSSDKDLTAIRKFLNSAGDAVNREDVEAEVNRFTEDGIYMWPDAPVIVGHHELRAWFEDRFSRVDATIENVSEELEVCGDWAFERGRYVASIRPKDREETTTIRGKYLNILRREPDGSWRIARRMRNRDHPAGQQ